MKGAGGPAVVSAWRELDASPEMCTAPEWVSKNWETQGRRETGAMGGGGQRRLHCSGGMGRAGKGLAGVPHPSFSAGWWAEKYK